MGLFRSMKKKGKRSLTRIHFFSYLGLLVRRHSTIQSQSRKGRRPTRGLKAADDPLKGENAGDRMMSALKASTRGQTKQLIRRVGGTRPVQHPGGMVNKKRFSSA
ncbi:hypothetical protein CDL15_Pgr000060 [Punica granatum]|uniref:Uncharacterized protein n=1 Tax=Punica granatum TaxID=22663 RepID=A0A218VQE3_PUNGR|nr:hypothetical protein CDL15_Pgr000060 [Punica granatum]